MAAWLLEGIKRGYSLPQCDIWSFSPPGAQPLKASCRQPRPSGLLSVYSPTREASDRKIGQIKS